jgi:hypothetical protein
VQTSIKTGLSASAIPSYIQFADSIYSFNGVDTPWYWNGVSQSNITTPAVAWATKQPSLVSQIRGNRLLAAAGSSLYWCVLGNPNDWVGTGAGSITDPFGDTADIRCLAPYGANVAVHSGRNRVYLFTGTDPANFALNPVASNQSGIGRQAVTTVNATQYFFTGTQILPLVTTDLGVIKLNESLDIGRRITPFFNGVDPGISVDIASQTNLQDAIFLPYDKKNQLIAYFKTSPGLIYNYAEIFNFNKGGWVFRKMTPITAAAIVNGKLLTGTADGKILQEFTGSTIVGASTIEKRIVSPYFSFGAPDLEKQLLKLYFWFKSSNATPATLKLRTNYKQQIRTTRSIPITLPAESVYNQAVYGSGYYADTATASFILNLPGVIANAIQFELLSTEPSFDFRFLAYAMEIEYLSEDVGR